MPLLSGGLVVITAVQESAGAAVATYHEITGTSAFTWIDPDGREWPLSNTSEDLGWFTLTGPSGWSAAPIEITSDSLPRGGESVRAISSKPATIQWPLEVFGADHEQFIGRYREISKAFKLTTVRRRPGVLRVQRPGGSVRQIEAFYSDGLAGEAEQNYLFARPVISLFCPDGKWREPEPIVAARTFTPTTGGDSAPVTFYGPFISLASSNVVGVPGGDGEASNDDDSGSLTTITNPGDVEAWPVWTVTGPMTQLRAWNETLGSRFALTYTLGAEQTITITTERPTVRGPGDANLSGAIDWFNTAGTELWPLADGENVVGLEVDGAEATTSVQMAFTPRYDNS